MRLLKILLIVVFVAVALTAGLVVTLVVGITAGAVWLLRRLLRHVPASARATPIIGRPTQAQNTSDVIEVTATEVPRAR